MDTNGSRTALGGVRVLDLTTGLPGALTTMVLADFGAEVIKVEPPGGDPDRPLPAFAMWHRGKRSVVADVRRAAGRARVGELAAGADVIVQSWRPGVAARWKLAYADLAPDHPEVIMCSITGFGPRGPLVGLKGYEGVVAAKAGVMWSGDGPRFAAVPGASFGAANGALQGILAALYARERTGRGQLVETSLVQGLTAYDLYDWLAPLVPPELLRFESPAGAAGSTIYPPISGIVAITKDGRCLQFGNFLPHQRRSFLVATGLDGWYDRAVGDGTSPEEVVATARRCIHAKTYDEWEEIFAAYPDVAVEAFRTTGEAVRHPQMRHNGDVVELDDPDLGPMQQLGPLVTMVATPAQLGTPAPRLTAGDDVVWTARAAAPATADPAPTAAPATGALRPPLDGVTVVELAWFYAAPFGLALMADLGARVIKVENLDGDPHRHQSGPKEFAGVKALQGKESIAVDMLTPEGMEIVHRLLGRADMVMRNFRESASEKMGINAAALRTPHPDLVYLYAAAYGASGPSALKPAYAPTMGVAVGHQALQLGWQHAFEDVPSLDEEEALRSAGTISARVWSPFVNADAGAALGVGTAMLLGLVARQRTGQAQAMQTTMLCTNAYAVSDDFLAYDGKTSRAVPDPDSRGIGPLYRLYPTADGWVFLAVVRDDEWDGLRRAMATASEGRVDLGNDSRFSGSSSRHHHAEALIDALTELFATRSAASWESLLASYDVACVEVSTEPVASFTIGHPTMVDNGFVGEVDHPWFGRHRRHAAIVSLSQAPATLGAGCLVGQHTRTIMDELGYSSAEIDDLHARGVIACRE